MNNSKVETEPISNLNNVGKKSFFKKRAGVTKKSKQEIIVSAIVFPILLIWSFTLLYPFVWAFLNSLKTVREFNANSFALPQNWLFSNWATAFKSLKVAKSNPIYTAGMFEMIFNSLWWTVANVLISQTITIMGAYAMSKYKFRLNKFLFAFSLILMTIPIVGAFPAQFKLYADLHFVNSPLILLAAAGCFGSANLMVYYSFFKSISWNYAEAVFIDGGGHWTVFIKVMLPQAVSIISALCIVAAIGAWNDYFTVYIYMQDYPTLATGLYLMTMQDVTKFNKPIYFAAVLFSVIPVFILFMLFQKKIMTSVSVGGLKG